MSLLLLTRNTCSPVDVQSHAGSSSSSTLH